MLIWSVSYSNCSSLTLYLLNFHSILKMIVIMPYFYYTCVTSWYCKDYVFYNSANIVYYLICLYRRHLATISPLGFYVLHYGSQYFNAFKEKENVLNKSSVQLGFFCCALVLDIYFKYVIDNYLL